MQSLFTACEPMHDLLHGKFTITNLDPSSPICKVKISASPSPSFSNSGLMIDNNTLIPGSFGTYDDSWYGNYISIELHYVFPCY
ncbi:MAG: hypothetical protein IPL25_12115 [Saprospiraceae bacterium]|nr:hypothetical protein [Candidatus Vicinibacter affinis]